MKSPGIRVRLPLTQSKRDAQCCIEMTRYISPHKATQGGLISRVTLIPTLRGSLFRNTRNNTKITLDFVKDPVQSPELRSSAQVRAIASPGTLPEMVISNFSCYGPGLW